MTGPTVYLHLGLPKSGTTFLQAMLYEHRARLRDDGVLYPPTRRGSSAHHGAATDLQHLRRGAGSVRATQGTWRQLVSAVHDWNGPGPVVVSSELLAFRTPHVARKAMRSLQPADVHLVVTMRDLVRQIPAVWQENVKNGSIQTYDQLLTHLVEQEVPWRGGGWRVQDIAAILECWGGSVPPDRVHIVTVPPPGTPAVVLWERFARVIGVDPGDYPLVPSGANTSLGFAEAEAVRRINERLGSVPGFLHGRYVKQGVAKQVLGGRSGSDRLRLPATMLPWVEERSQQMVDFVAAGGYRVEGDLDDLLPPKDGYGVGEVSAPDPQRVADASAAAAGYLAQELAGLGMPSAARGPRADAVSRHGLRRGLSRLSDRHRMLAALRRGYRLTRRLRAAHRSARG